MNLNDKIFKEIRCSYRDRWFHYSNDLNISLDRVSYMQKIRNEKQLDNIVNAIISKIKNYPEDNEARIQWKMESQEFSKQIFKEISILRLGLVDDKLKKGFIDSTYSFIKRCREFDKEISFEDIGQALRNVWIVNILQKIFGSEVRFNEAVFAYSMLYPYTDNFLDDITVDGDGKRDFNERFSRKIEGLEVEALNDVEDKAFKMIELIERQYERNKYEDVYRGLDYIQRGQIKSLKQQSKKTNPYECDMLDISIEKGGASVLADGLLIDGTMDLEKIDFCVGYGFLLQLCDDLQDVDEDFSNNHMTVMSQICTGYKLDNIVNKLINFTNDLVISAKCFKCENSMEVRKLIIENILLMIVTAVGMNKKYFSREYASIIEQYIPFRIRYIRGLADGISNKFKKLEPEYGGVKVDRILYDIFY